MNTDQQHIENMYNLVSDGSIKTFTGKINVFNILPEDIDVIDIAHGLSFHAARWVPSGHCFYPVAKHCIEACQIVSEEYKLEALLHDASEAYLLDMASPIKKQLPDYKKLEDNLMSIIAKKYGFNYPISKEVKIIDKQLLEYEWVNHVIKRTEIIRESNYYFTEFLRLYNIYK